MSRWTKFRKASTKKWVQFCFTFLISFFLLWLVLLLEKPILIENALQIKSGKFSPLSQPVFPPQNTLFKNISLPHKWIKDQKHIFGIYQFQFEYTADQNQLYALFIPSFKSNLEVYINGHFIGNTGVFFPRITRNWRDPAYFQIHGQLLAGANNLTLVAGSAYPGSGFICCITFGTAKDIKPAFSFAYHKSTTFVVVQMVILTFSILLLISLYIKDGYAVYLYLIYANVALLCHLQLLLITGNWFSVPGVIGNTTLLCKIWFCYYILKAHYYMFNIPASGFEKWTFHACLFFTIGYIADMFIPLKFTLNYVFACGVFIYAAHIILMYSKYVKLLKFTDTVAFHSMAIIMLTLGIVDLLIYLGYSTYGGNTLFYGIWLFSVVFTSKAFFLSTEKKLNQARHRFKEKIDHVKTAERKKIRRDLHDGVAGKLSTLLISLDSGSNLNDIEYQIQIALSELRDVLSHHTTNDANLFQMLIKVKQQVDPILTKLNILGIWEIELPENANVEPAKVHHIMRMLQECISNIIKHAQATNIRISATHQKQQYQISINDDGIGFGSMQPNANTCGLESLKHRSEQIDGTLSIDTSPSGTCVQLTFR